jgi:hypothetical protein
MTYTLFLIAARGLKANAPVETIECSSDAQALVEACKFFRRMPDVDVIEVWEEGRKVVSLGGRERGTLKEVFGHRHSPERFSSHSATAPLRNKSLSGFRPRTSTSSSAMSRYLVHQ